MKPVIVSDVSDFQNAARPHVKKCIPIPDFYTDLKKILEISVKLNILAYYTRFDIKEKCAQIRENVHKNIQKNPFKVLMPDAISKKDRIRRNKLMDQWNKNTNRFISYGCDDESIVFPFDECANHFLAISPNHPHIIKTNLASAKKLKNILENDKHSFSYFTNLLDYFHKFYSNVSPPYTQKKWDEFLHKNCLDAAISTYWQNTVNPSIMMLVDMTRRFLNEALITEHWSEIAPTKQMAQLKLKNDKTLIYSLSEKYGYIEKSDPFLKCEQMRNYIAHPSREEGLLPDAFSISKIYEHLVFNFIDQDFLHQYYEKSTFSFPMTDIQRQCEEYQTIRNADFFVGELGQLLPSELQGEPNKKKLNFLNQKGILTAQESQQMSQLFLQRNAIAHGQTDTQKISKSLFDVTAMHHALVHRQRFWGHQK